MKNLKVMMLLLVSFISTGWTVSAVHGETTETVLLPAASQWHYHDLGPDQYPGDNWMAQDADVSQWKNGAAPLGYSTKADIATTLNYGENREKKHPVYFFRQQFDVANAESLKEAGGFLKLQYKIDDSAVIYLNGHEISRINYPEDAVVNFKDYSGRLGDDGTAYSKLMLDMNQVSDYFVDGTNTIAAAVFQQSGTSSDLVFDLGVSIGEAAAEAYQPTKISSVYHGSPASTRGLTWHTALAASSIVRYVASPVAPTDWSQADVIEGTSTTVPVIDGFSHKAVLEGLQPDTTYWYQVGDAVHDAWSDTHTFKTEKTGGPVRFLYFADVQGSSEYDYDIVAKTFYKGLTVNSAPDFIVQGGDLVNDSDNSEQWHWLFSKMPDIWANQTIMAVAGNHDAVQQTFANHFNHLTPASGTQATGSYYSYDYQFAHFVMLNTNDLVNNQLNPVQVEWLKSDIQQAKARGQKWVIVTMHRGVQTIGNHIGARTTVGLRRQLQPIFHELGVDVVLQGHDHTYARTNQMGPEMPIDTITYETVDGVMTAKKASGVLYLTANSSGTKFYSMKSAEVIKEQGVYPAVKGQNYKQMFTDFIITADKLLLTSYEYDAEDTESLTIFDRYAVEKSSETTESSTTESSSTTENSSTTESSSTTEGSSTTDTRGTTSTSDVTKTGMTSTSSQTSRSSNRTKGIVYPTNQKNQGKLPRTGQKPAMTIVIAGLSIVVCTTAVCVSAHRRKRDER